MSHIRITRLRSLKLKTIQGLFRGSDFAGHTKKK